MKNFNRDMSMSGQQRRDALRLVAAGVAAMAMPKIAFAAGHDAVATADEPLHHIILLNEYVRVMHVLIPPGQSTLWHEQHLDYVNTIIRGTPVTIERTDTDKINHTEMPTGTIRFGAHAVKSVADKVTNSGSTMNEQIAFEILSTKPGQFGKADRKGAAEFTLALDKPLVRGWKVTLAPGASTGRYTQNGPGVRVILSGERLAITPKNNVGQEYAFAAPYAMLTHPGADKLIANTGSVPLTFFDYELL